MSNGNDNKDKSDQDVPFAVVDLEVYKSWQKSKQKKYLVELKKRIAAPPRDKESADPDKKEKYKHALEEIERSETTEEKAKQAEDPIQPTGSPGVSNAMKYAGAGVGAITAGIGVYNAAATMANDYIDDEYDKLKQEEFKEKCLFTLDENGNPIKDIEALFKKCKTNADCPPGGTCVFDPPNPPAGEKGHDPEQLGQCEPKCKNPWAVFEGSFDDDSGGAAGKLDQVLENLGDFVVEQCEEVNKPLPTVKGCVTPYATHFFNYVPIHYYLMQKMMEQIDALLGLDQSKIQINAMIKEQASCKAAASDNNFEFTVDELRAKAKFPMFDLGIFPLDPLPYFKIELPCWLIMIADPGLVVRRIVIDTICFTLCKFLNAIMLAIAEMLMKKMKEEQEALDLSTGISSVMTPVDLTKIDINPFVADESLIEAYNLGLIQTKDTSIIRAYITESIMNDNKDDDGNLFITMQDVLDLLAGASTCRAMGEMIRVGIRTHNEPLGLKEEKAIRAFWIFIGDHVDVFAYINASKADCEPYICPPEFDEELLNKYKDGIAGICELMKKPEDLLGDLDPEKLALALANNVLKDHGLPGKLDKCNPSLLFGEESFKKKVLNRKCQKIPRDLYNIKTNTDVGKDKKIPWPPDNYPTSPGKCKVAGKWVQCTSAAGGGIAGVPDSLDPWVWNGVSPDHVYAHTGDWQTGTKTAKAGSKKFEHFYFDGNESEYTLSLWEDMSEHKNIPKGDPRHKQNYGKTRWPGIEGEPKGNCIQHSNCPGYKVEAPKECSGKHPSPKCESSPGVDFIYKGKYTNVTDAVNAKEKVGKCQTYGWIGHAKEDPWSSWSIPLYYEITSPEISWPDWICSAMCNKPYIPNAICGVFCQDKKPGSKCQTEGDPQWRCQGKVLIDAYLLYTIGTVGNGVWFYSGDCDN